MILCYYFLLLNRFGFKELIVESRSSEEVKLRTTQDDFFSKTNLSFPRCDSSRTLKLPAFSRLKEPGSVEFAHFIGSNLFDGDRKECFSSEDINLLAARRAFEATMIPPRMPPILDDKSISVIMRYFSHGHFFIRRMKNCRSSRVLRKAFFDTFGGFLHHYLLPVIKMSFYVGDVKLKIVRKVLDYYQKCRFFLNTNCNGWRSPFHYSLHDVNCFSSKSIFTDDQSIESCDDYCLGLNIIGSKESDAFDENMIVPLPRIDLEDKDGFLGNIWLPYERKTIYSLTSHSSAFLLVKFYKKVSLCYWQKKIPRDAFDIKFKQWISENLLIHVFDEKFYPSLGGLISLYKNLLDPKEGYTSINAEDDDGNDVGKTENSKYFMLDSKSKLSSVCDRDWFPIIHKPEIHKKTNKNQKNKHSNNRKGKAKKDKMEKAGIWSKYFNWFADDKTCDSKSLKKLDDLAKSNLPEKQDWWETLKTILKYIIWVLAILFILYVCKLICLCIDMMIGVEGSIRGDCFSVMWNLITEFFKKSYQVFTIFFAFMFAELRKCCTKDKTVPANKVQFKKSYRPEKRIMDTTKLTENKIKKLKTASKPPQKVANDSDKITSKKDSKKSKRKASVRSVSSEKKMGKNSDVPKPTKKSGKSKKNSTRSQSQTTIESNSARKKEKSTRTSKKDLKKKKDSKKSLSKSSTTSDSSDPQTSHKAKVNFTRTEKRLLGGELREPIEIFSDSSNPRESKKSWKTFYDF